MTTPDSTDALTSPSVTTFGSLELGIAIFAVAWTGLVVTIESVAVTVVVLNACMHTCMYIIVL